MPRSESPSPSPAPKKKKKVQARTVKMQSYRDSHEASEVRVSENYFKKPKLNSTRRTPASNSKKYWQKNLDRGAGNPLTT